MSKLGIRMHRLTIAFSCQGAPIRHEDMKSAELRIQEEFEKKYNRLEAAHQAVEQRVEQGYKLREGVGLRSSACKFGPV
jgi:hypothetical protein